MVALVASAPDGVSMKIELLHTLDCPHFAIAEELIQEVLAETGIPAELELVPIDSVEEAHRMRFVGSPTVRVEGLDVEPYVTFAATEFGLACRIYREHGQVTGWPSRRQLTDAIEMGWLAAQGILVGCC